MYYDYGLGPMKHGGSVNIQGRWEARDMLEGMGIARFVYRYPVDQDMAQQGGWDIMYQRTHAVSLESKELSAFLWNYFIF